jgi:hypothetical protein
MLKDQDSNDPQYSNEDFNRQKMEIDRLKAGNKKLLQKIQNYKVAILVMLSFVLPLFILLAINGFLVMPGVINNAQNVAQTPDPIVITDTVYLYGMPSAMSNNNELFGVVIGAYTQLDVSDFEPNLTNQVQQISYDNMNQISLGIFENADDAKPLLDYVKKMGFHDAYIKKVELGARIIKRRLQESPPTNNIQSDSLTTLTND